MFIVKMTNCEFKVEQGEVASVMDGVARGVIKVFKQGVMNPSYFVALIPDPNPNKEKEVDDLGRYTGNMIALPLKDMFGGLREEILKLTETKKI